MVRSYHRRAFCAATAIGLACLSLPAMAQEWPTAPLHLFVGFPAGSSPDTIARLVAEPLSEALGQPVVVENKPGAGGVIGVQQMLAQQDGGLSFGITINGPLTTAPRLIADLGYDPASDIAPVGLIATSPLVLVVGSDFPADDAAAFIEDARAHPGEISYGSVGQGSGAHLTAELFASEAGIELFHIPFQSYAEVTTSILGGEIDTGFMAPSAAVAHVEAGKMKMLGITSSEPFAQVPDVPVLAGQAGLPDDFRAELWNAFIAPAGTDEAVVQRLNAELGRILADPEVQEKLLAIGWQTAPGTPQDLSRRIAEDTAMWGEVIDKTQTED
ncbi:Bug family tripartite tricarboxylate transporter substrate binding protein [Paracoccus seriniphilus]|uniref:Tripartite-type tricarboxylate transporter, receptor component TctC n=1 Tax=Paracoccus seriniphilus TaxID=184748 RepID=A0A239PRI3_9RHOB|nr:tripartite tricarboxylate transporter substrate binding protein [Paracoccus seriniphilus]WCR12821.1 tripartite tricarboxylate transporter substrate binding protein [Paracoccus seriniphilus]SNT72760.1 Tripartite-type tricarboxylate transporter, receptor component TctC [Paracoccus seriniphilus]